MHNEQTRKPMTWLKSKPLIIQYNCSSVLALKSPFRAVSPLAPD